MKLLFMILTVVVLTLYSITAKRILKPNEHVAIILRLDTDRTLVHVFPQNHCVIVNSKEKNYYVYLDADSDETYVPALRIDPHEKVTVNIFNHKYLKAWHESLPVIKSYPENLKKDLVSILNYLNHE